MLVNQLFNFIQNRVKDPAWSNITPFTYKLDCCWTTMEHIKHYGAEDVVVDIKYVPVITTPTGDITSKALVGMWIAYLDTTTYTFLSTNSLPMDERVKLVHVDRPLLDVHPEIELYRNDRITRFINSVMSTIPVTGMGSCDELELTFDPLVHHYIVKMDANTSWVLDNLGPIKVILENMFSSTEGV